MLRIKSGGARAKAQLRGGVLRFSWLRGAVINEADARAAVTATGLLSAGRTYPLLVELSGLARMSCKAQKVFVAPSPATRVALLGSSPVDRVIANFYMGPAFAPLPDAVLHVRKRRNGMVDSSSAVWQREQHS